MFGENPHTTCVEGGLVRRGRRTPLLFGPEGMRRSEVHAAGVLRMKQAAYY